MNDLQAKRWICRCPDCHAEWCTYLQKPWFSADEDWPERENIMDLRCPRCERRYVQQMMREEQRLLRKFERGPYKTQRFETKPLPFDDVRGVQSNARAIHA